MRSRRQQPMAVIGAGSWGTALAIQLARAGIPARLWGRDTGQMHALQRVRCNERYLPDAAFPAALEVATELRCALDCVSELLVAAPSPAFRATLELVGGPTRRNSGVGWATKGCEISSGLLPHQVAR